MEVSFVYNNTGKRVEEIELMPFCLSTTPWRCIRDVEVRSPAILRYSYIIDIHSRNM